MDGKDSFGEGGFVRRFCRQACALTTSAQTRASAEANDSRWNNDELNPAFRSVTAGDFEVVQLGWR